MKNKGYFGIGIMNPKTEMNVGSLWRSANIFDVSFIFTIGKRIPKQASDTMKTCNSIPFYYYETFEEFYKSIPYGCRIVGVEIDNKSIKIEQYKHLDKCIYLLGAEDNGITIEARNKCHELIQLPKGNYNVANAGSIVLYDRYLKSTVSIAPL
jgi:tRNA (guanosine-2'-O-)-methyltransferase